MGSVSERVGGRWQKRVPDGGEELLLKQIFRSVDNRFQDISEEAWGDSPIEKLFFTALVCRFLYDPTEFSEGVMRMTPDRKERMLKEPIYKNGLLLESQAQIGSARVDFIIYAWTEGEIWKGGPRKIGEPRWRRLVVECDGHDFHERTKEQVARDRSRDRAHTIDGYEVFRFTGSELWRDPWGCADQVYEWALREFC